MAAAALAALIAGSIAAPQSLGWSVGLASAESEEPANSDPAVDESVAPGESLDPDLPPPGSDEPALDPGATDGEGGAIDPTPSETAPTPTPPAHTLRDLLSAATARRPFSGSLALGVLFDYAPIGARAIEVADRPSFRDARTYTLREVRRWTRLPQLGITSTTVWMRFVGGFETTPFAVAAGRDRSDPRITSVRVRQGRASHSNPPPYLLTALGSDVGTGMVAVEVRVGYERPLRFATADEIEIGPRMETPGGKVIVLMRGVIINVRLIDAAGNESAWRSVRLP